ncbi:MAG: fatty acid desaturase family protein [Acidothermaceae bacterium]
MTAAPDTSPPPATPSAGTTAAARSASSAAATRSAGSAPSGGETPPARRRTASDYAALSRMVKDAGLLERRRWYYRWRLALNVVLVAVAGFAIFIARGTWWELFVAVYFAIVSTQLAFTGHEAGHRQIFRTRQANELAGYLHGNLMIGLSYDWWVDKHNRHHRNPNQIDTDPDIGNGVLVFSDDAAIARGRVGRFFARKQAFFFFPLLMLESLNLHVASIRNVVRTGARNRGIEAVLLAAHEIGYLALVFLSMSPLQAVAFIVVHQALFGMYLGCSFAPNHKGMRMLTPEESMDFLRRQVLTSRNVRGGAFVGALLGGLNWQIEHHLFPSMPRPNLRRARTLVRQFCADNGLPYAETSLFRSYALAVRHLHQVGKNPVSTQAF